jgi:hypothetical protein
MKEKIVRKNIFEILSKNFDVAREIKTIWRLFTKDARINVLCEYEEYLDDLVSILDFVNSYSFANWKSRNLCASSSDMMNRLGIDDHFVDELNTFSDKVLLVLEFIINMLDRCEITIKENSDFEVNNEYQIQNENIGSLIEHFENEKYRLKFEVNNEYQILNENTNSFIEHFGYEKYRFKDEEQVILIEKNPAAISAAEISEPEIAKKIIQYNHYTLKGNVDTKKEILITLANEVEPQRKKLVKVNSSFSDDLFFLLNNMNLRHNNVEPNDKNYRPFIATMDNKTLESWYDEIYQMILLAKLLLDNVARTSNIKTLKKNITKTETKPLKRFFYKYTPFPALQVLQPALRQSQALHQKSVKNNCPVDHSLCNIQVHSLLLQIGLTRRIAHCLFL